MRLAASATLATAALLLASGARAQFGRGLDSHMASNSSDGRSHYCRAQYRMNLGGDGGSWLTDYPLADIDLSVRLSELTKTTVAFDQAGQPRHLIVRLTGDELFQCPFIMMQEARCDERAAPPKTQTCHRSSRGLKPLASPGSTGRSQWQRRARAVAGRRELMNVRAG